MRYENYGENSRRFANRRYVKSGITHIACFWSCRSLAEQHHRNKTCGQKYAINVLQGRLNKMNSFYWLYDLKN